MQYEPVDQVVVGLLGVVGTRVDGVLTPIPGTRARALLVALALEPGRRRSVASLVDDVWPDAPPRAPKNALQTQISRLRSALPVGAVDSGPAGYRLTLGAEDVDLTLAEGCVAEAERMLTGSAYVDALELVRRARALWRGEPGSDVPEGVLADALVGRSTRAEESLEAIEMAALLGTGSFDRALPQARRAVENDRLDEDAAANLMRCLRGLGRINEALTVFAEVSEALADRLGADPSDELVELNAALLRPAQPKSPASIGLRASPNELIGREADIDAIEAMMSRSRVTTILGPGGSGKTRLAHEIGTRTASAMPVAVIELASLGSGQDVATAISGSLGLSETDLALGGLGVVRVQTSRERLREALSGRPGLLILDNCEHVIDDVAQVVNELVSASSTLTVLATSRAPMSITAEVGYPLPPLEIGGRGSAAAELFVARAQAVRPGAAFDHGEVDRLCRTLDGLPLAIELAAARVRTLTVADINARLEHRFALLRTTDRTRPERHRTLHAVIDWSWNLLQADQQQALARLCMLPAGFTAAAAERVAGFGDVGSVADALDGLVGQSLLTVVEEKDHVRYHMLETVREFGEEQLTAEDATTVTARMVDWGADLARMVANGYTGGRQVEVMEVIEADHDNLLDVLRRAHRGGRWRQMYSIFATLSFFWSMRGAHTEVSNWAPRILDAPAEGPDVGDVADDDIALAHFVILAHVGYNGDMRTLAHVRIRLRRILRARTAVDPGLRFIGETLVGRSDGKGLARTLARAVRSPEAAVRNSAFMIRASLHENFGYLREAVRDVEAAKVIAAERHDLWSVASAAQSLGSIHGQSGRFEEAIENYTQASDLMWTLHAYDESMQMRGFAGSALIAAGRIAEGRALMEDIVEMSSGVESTLPADEHDADQRLASTTAALGEADIAEGDIPAGLAKFRRSVEISGFSHERQGDPYLTMLASASVSAHALHGGVFEIADAAALLESVAAVRLGPSGFRDLPQLGAVACAIGSYDVQSGRNPERGIRLLAVSVKARARLDYPSMDPLRHLDAARKVIGDDLVDEARMRTARMTRAGALSEIQEILRP